MSEPKRATFTTISTQKGDVKIVTKKRKTIRFSLTLPESNEKSCPEYNYRDLLNSAEKKIKLKEKPQGQVNGLNHLDPFDDNDDDVKRIAKQFEAKYGLLTNKKRRGKKDDYADIGAGYDESDSFIDNTDAYDEMVPEDVTTVHGGFYINSGALEFKQVELSVSDSSDSEVSEHEKSSNRKRIIEDSDSESEEEKEETKIEQVEKKPKIETNGVQKPVKKKIILTDEKENAVKKKKVEDTIQKKKLIEENIQKKKPVTVKELLREKREEFDVPITQDSSQKEIKPSGSSTINDVIESVINAGRIEHIDEASKDSTSSSDAAVSAASSESESSRDGLPTTSEQPQVEAQRPEAEIPIVKLPENIPDNVMKIINDIKKAAENSEGKVKFFSGSVNNMLLSLEVNSRKLMRSDRVQIFEHLAPFVKCKKDTLMRRAKNLLLDQERSKLKDPLLRLKVIVDNIMPLVKKTYEKECQKVRDEMFMASATSANSDNDVNNKVNKLKIPKKKFPWSEETRKVLQEIIIIQKKYFTLVRTRKETFEANLEMFLKATILPIWPDGFMTLATLMKQSKLILVSIEKRKSPSVPMAPISLDIHATPIGSIAPTSPFIHSPVKNMSLSPCSTGVSGITVIPIPQSSISTSKAAIVNGPKLKHSPPIKSEISVSVNKKVEPPSNSTSVINMSAEICAVTKETKECNERVPSSLLIPSTKSSVTITSVDLRTNNNINKKDTMKEEDNITVTVTDHVSKSVTPIPPVPAPKPSNLKQRILNDITSNKPRMENNDDCQIIDLTDAPVVIRKPGPKSKTRYVDGSVAPKRVKEAVEHSARSAKSEDFIQKKSDEVTGSQAFDHLITGLIKYGSNSTDLSAKSGHKDNTAVNEDDMEQVMKDLKELQQLQEHAKKNEIDIMAPSSSPVSVIAFNNSFSSSRLQANDLSTAKERKLAVDSSGFQDIFQKHLFQEPSLLKPSQSSSVYNSNVQPKNNYNSISNFSYSSAGSISNTMNNIRYSQSSSKYPSSMNHLPPNPPGATNHTDDFALFQNFLYQYGFHNSSGSKQKSPP